VVVSVVGDDMTWREMVRAATVSDEPEQEEDM